MGQLHELINCINGVLGSTNIKHASRHSAPLQKGEKKKNGQDH